MGIVYIEKCDSYKHAIKREKDIKRLTLTKKLKLIEDYKLLWKKENVLHAVCIENFLLEIYAFFVIEQIKEHKKKKEIGRKF